MAKIAKTIELLAPAGKWETMTEVLAAGADAVYLGGKRFNMRMLKANHNFSDEELRSAVDYAHEREKKLYVTINNLYYQHELAELKDYLGWLQEIKVDALIVQDLAVAQLAKTSFPGLPLHASVQMGIGNSAAAGCLEKNGFSRVVLSKNLSVNEIKSIHEASSLELEYFIHGDLCISHTGQCYLSSFIFGECGNRGRCKKPCRWAYQLQGREIHPTGYYLAHNDLCLLEELPRLLEAGVISLKIEGRMRDAGYLNRIIWAYREALACWEQDRPLPTEIKDHLELTRVRDFTTAGFSHRPTRKDIGVSGEREPAFPTAPIPVLPDLRVSAAGEADIEDQLQVLVNHPSIVSDLVNTGVKVIIIGLPDNLVDHTEWQAAAAKTRDAGARIIVQLPRVVTEGQLEQVHHYLAIARKLGVDTIMASELGSMQLALDQGFNVWGDYGLNLTNGEAVAWLAEQGLERVTASLELKHPQLAEILDVSLLPVDMLVHGRLPGIITDLCLRMAVDEGCSRDSEAADLLLIDAENNYYPLDCDDNCRYSIYYPYELALIGHLALLNRMGVNGLRLDLTAYDPEFAVQVVKLYQQALKGKADLQSLQAELSNLTGRQYTDTTFWPSAQEPNNA